METQKVLIGSIVALSSGAQQDTTRPVEFEAELLAYHREYGTNKGQPTDTRGVTETLYKLEDGRLAVHVKDWSNWQGEPTTYRLHEITETDLTGDGQFWALGFVAGYGRPLTFDEATAEPTDADSLAGGDVVSCAVCDGLVEPGDNHDVSPEGAVVCAACM